MSFESPFKERYVPVMGDIHGNLAGLVNTVKQLQRDTGRRFETVLQVGDFGYFPKNKDGKEDEDPRLGVHNYFNDRKIRDRYMGDRDIGFRIIFIRGNHEDQLMLNRLSNEQQNGLIRLDQIGFLNYLPDGRVIDLEYNRKSVHIAGFGGIDPNSRMEEYKRNPLIGFSSKGMDELLECTGDVDVLLTHQGPKEAVEGSKEINKIYDILKPRLAIHGHSHDIRSHGLINGTDSYSLDDMNLSPYPLEEKISFYGIIDLASVSPAGIEFIPCPPQHSLN